MVFTFFRRRESPVKVPETRAVTWKCRCYFCERPIIDGAPILMLSTSSPLLVGVSHAFCGYNDNRYGQFPLCPPEYLSIEEVSFLAHFYPRLFSLPGAEQGNSDLRRALASILPEYPLSISDPLAALHRFQKENEDQYQFYGSDLESEYLRFLDQVHQAARTHSERVEIDFRKKE